MAVQKSNQISNEQLLQLNHEIREREYKIKAIRRRRALANVSSVLLPIILLSLYLLWLIPWFNDDLFRAILAPGIVAALILAVLVYNLRFGEKVEK